MYKRSKDLRFVKNKVAMQNAFIELSLEIGLQNVTVTQLTDKAMVNRMTFYAHYDSLTDLISEYFDEKLVELHEAMDQVEGFDAEILLRKTKELLGENLDFYKMVFDDGGASFDTGALRRCYEDLVLRVLEQKTAIDPLERKVLASVITAGINFVFVDWITGRFGDAPEEDIAEALQAILERAVGKVDAC